MGSWRRRAIVGTGCLVLAAGGLSVAAAASPTVRSALGFSQGPVTVESLPGGAGLAGAYPGISHVLNPNYIPSGLTAREFAYYPGHSSTGHTRVTILAYDKASHGTGSGEAILWQEGVPAVYEGFFSPGNTRYFELLQRATGTGRTLAAGQTISVAGTAATIHQEGAVTVAELAKSGTLVTIRTDLGKSEALKIAGSLR
jgi:hypothetical protein